MAYNSAFDLDSMVVPMKAATIFAAHETSLFLGGQLIPSAVIPAGSASLQVPLLGSVTATKISAEGVTDDIAVTAATDTKVTIAANIYAARSVLRDLGAIDPNEIGRMLGNSVSKAFDTDVIAALKANAITNAVDTGGTVTLNFLFDALQKIRESGDMSQVFGVLSPSMATNLLKNIGSAAYAGSAFQGEALRNADLGVVAGVRLFVSSYMTANQGTLFTQDAFRIGMHRGVELEVGRRPEAVGFDVVANLHAGVGLVDAARAVRLYDVA
jgi:hypothetical protein